MIEELRSKQMQQEMEHERQILKKLKMKMDRIKATQQKIIAEEPKTHAAGMCTGIPFYIILFLRAIRSNIFFFSCKKEKEYTNYFAVLVNTFFKVLKSDGICDTP